MASGSCEILCDTVYDCVIFDGVEPNSPTCASDCLAEDRDGCVPQTTALVACVEQATGGDCDVDPRSACQSQIDAYLACADA